MVKSILKGHSDLTEQGLWKVAMQARSLFRQLLVIQRKGGGCLCKTIHSGNGQIKVLSQILNCPLL